MSRTGDPPHPPAVPPPRSSGAVEMTEAHAVIEDAARRGVPVIVQAPRGYGKTTLVSEWAASHPERDIVWVRSGRLAVSWLEVAAIIAERLGVEPPRFEGDPYQGAESFAEWARFLARLDARGRPFSIVVDCADSLEPALGVDELVDVAERMPNGHLVLIARRLDDRFATVPSRIALVTSSVLSWGLPEAARAIRQGIADPPPDVLAELVELSEGRAEAILDGARTWARERHERPEGARRSPEQLVVGWTVERIAEAGGDAAPFVLAVADLIELPEDLLDPVAGLFEGVSAEVVDRLLDEGFLARRASVFSGAAAMMAPRALREPLARLARATLGTRLHGAHRVVVGSERYAHDAPSLHAYHRSRSGDADAAIEALDGVLRDGANLDHATVVALLADVPPARLREDAGLLAFRVALTDAVDQAELEAPELRQAVMGLSAATLRGLDPASRLMVETARLQILLRRGDLAQAARRGTAIAEQWFPHRQELGHGASRALAVLLTVAAEAQMLVLRPDRALDLARRALSLPERDRWLFTSFRSASVAALSYALAGEHDRMQRARREANLYYGLAGITASRAPLLLWAAELCDAWMRRDVADLDAIVGRFRSRSRADPEAVAVGIAADAFLALARGDTTSALSAADRLRATGPLVPQAGVLHAVGLLVSSSALLEARRPGAALSVLEGAESPHGHALCIESVRASAYLALGRHQAVLAATSACVRPRERHSHGTLPLVLMLRAVAHLELRHVNSARDSFVDALTLVEVAWRPGLLAQVPPTTITALRRLVPEGALSAEILADLDARASSHDRTAPAANLTEREAELLELLREDIPLVEIAQRRFVSINTIKTQLKSLYRKLGVSSRHEAADLAFQFRIAVEPRSSETEGGRGARGESGG